MWMPSTLHVIWIPGVFMVGLWLGYFLAMRQVRARGGIKRTSDDELRDYDA